MEGFIDIIKRYRYGFLVLLIGIGFMLLPAKGREEKPPTTLHTEEAASVSDSLEQILSQIDGVGRVAVMLSQSEGERTVYQTDTDQSGDSYREDAVVITGESRDEQGQVQQVIPPRYQGCLVVCQGGDRAVVRLAVVEAVSALTGLSSNHITVVKMK